MEIQLCGPRGVVVGDGSARGVPLACHRKYDLTVAELKWDGSPEEMAATKLSRWQRLMVVLGARL